MAQRQGHGRRVRLYEQAILHIANEHNRDIVLRDLIGAPRKPGVQGREAALEAMSPQNKRYALEKTAARSIGIPVPRRVVDNKPIKLDELKTRARKFLR